MLQVRMFCAAGTHAPWRARAGGTGGPQRRLRNRHDRLRARGL